MICDICFEKNLLVFLDCDCKNNLCQTCYLKIYKNNKFVCPFCRNVTINDFVYMKYNFIILIICFLIFLYI